MSYGAGSAVPGDRSTYIQMAATAHLCEYSRIAPFLGHAPPRVYWVPLRRDLMDHCLRARNGAIPSPTQPGIGSNLPGETVDRIRMR